MFYSITPEFCRYLAVLVGELRRHHDIPDRQTKVRQIKIKTEIKKERKKYDK